MKEHQDNMRLKSKTEGPSPKRRSFLNKIWSLLGAVALLELTWIGHSVFQSKKKNDQYLTEPSLVTAGIIEDFATGTISPIPHGHFYLACLKDGAFLAISPICTHLGCTITWDEEKQKFICPCHGSTFNMVGEVLSSPATRPLDIFPTRIEDGKIIVNVELRQRREKFDSSQVTKV